MRVDKQVVGAGVGGGVLEVAKEGEVVVGVQDDLGG